MTKTWSRTTLSMLGAGYMRVTELQGTERGTWIACVLTHLLGYDQVLWYKSFYPCELLKFLQGLQIFLGVPTCAR